MEVVDGPMRMNRYMQIKWGNGTDGNVLRARLDDGMNGLLLCHKKI